MSVTMQQNVTAIHTAHALYHLRAEYHGIAIDPWESLSPAMRRQWVEAAQRILQDLAPAPRRVHPDYFEVAAGLARSAKGDRP